MATPSLDERPAERSTSAALRPYVPALLIEWLERTPQRAWREVEGTLAYVDISGFTTMTERLARLGKVGAEELNDILDACFARLLGVAARDGADLLKWGGDAVLLLFRGDGHAPRACRAAAGMRRELRSLGTIATSAGGATLRMSVGIHSGVFHLFLVGDLHRELVLTGPAATRVAAIEASARAGQIALTHDAAALLDPRVLGPTCGDGRLLRAVPIAPPPGERPTADLAGIDIASSLAAPLREHLLHDAAAEHRRIAVAFIEFAGSDAIIEHEGPDALADALHGLVGRVQAAAAAEGVTFLETDIATDGGKIMLIAGAPATRGDDEERMLRTVRTVLDGGGPLPLRAGANAGSVFAGDFGPAQRRTYSVKGDAVNLAARLAARAAPGQLLATAALLERSAATFAAQPLPPFSVKGKRRPIEALAVGAPRDAAPAVVPYGPISGRERELGVLRAALAEALAGTGVLVEIAGEPGIGKTRLAIELLIEARGASTVAFSCERYRSATPYAAVGVLLRRVLGARDDDGHAELAERLAERTASVLPTLRPWLPLVGVALGLDLPETPETAALAERFRKQRLEEACALLVAAVAAGPHVIVLDDAHWMDEASAGVVRQLLRGVADLPWLVCISRRDDAGGLVPPAALERRVIRPAPLEAAAAAELVAAATDASPLAPHDVTALTSRAGGNPLFLIELLAARQAGAAAESLPDSIEAVATAQIDRLAPADRRVLRRAAVLGSPFAEDVLAELLDGEAPDAATWSRLEAFVEPARRGMRRFRALSVRDAAYEGLPFRDRRQLHARAASALERIGGGEATAELLSLHSFHAHRYDDAWRYSRLAGERAQAVYANVEAARFYERALDAARLMGEKDSAPVAAVREALGDVQKRLGEFRRAEIAYRGARRAAGSEPVTRARLLLKHALIAERLGRYSAALRWIAAGRDAVSGVAGAGAAQQLAQLSVWRAAILQASGRHADAVRWCGTAIAEAEASGDRDALAHAYFILDWAYVDLGRIADATHSPLALAIYEELGDLGRQAVVCNNMGAFAYYQGRWDEAIELYERGRTARARTGDAVNAAYGTSNIGEIRSDQGRLGEARPLFTDALRVWQAAGDRGGIAFATSALGRVSSRAGRHADALELLGAAREGFVHLGARADVIDTDARIAECHALRGDGEAALALADDTLVRARPLAELHAQLPLLARVRGFALAQSGDREGARVALGESLAAARRREAAYEVGVTLDALARLTKRGGGAEQHAFRSEADEILVGLGVMHLAVPPALV